MSHLLTSKYASLLHKLEVEENLAGWVLIGLWRTMHITSMLLDLHCLSINTTKIISFINGSIYSSLALKCIKELIKFYTLVRNLKSASDVLILVVSNMKRKLSANHLLVQKNQDRGILGNRDIFKELFQKQVRSQAEAEETAASSLFCSDD